MIESQVKIFGSLSYWFDVYKIESSEQNYQKMFSAYDSWLMSTQNKTDIQYFNEKFMNIGIEMYESSSYNEDIEEEEECQEDIEDDGE